MKNYFELLEQNKEVAELWKVALDLVNTGIQAADPKQSIFSSVEVKENSICLKDGWEKKIAPNSKIIVIGAGKATAAMGMAVELLLGDLIVSGLLNVPKATFEYYQGKELVLQEAGHPYVTEKTIKGTKEIIDLVSNLTEDDIVICLISGGGSALLELPYDWVSLHDLKQVFDTLTSKGASIHELNILRKHLSQVKGGKLAEIIHPAQVITLIISDVIGDTLDTIASGLTASDTSTWFDVEKIITKYNLKEILPKSIMKTIKEGLLGTLKETLKPDNPIFKKVHNLVIASNYLSCKAIEKHAKELDLLANIESTTLAGEARLVGRAMAQKLKEAKNRTVLVAGGETIVKIQGTGKGGRNQEVALAASKILQYEESVVIVAVGTDGIDGPTDAAGALVDGQTINLGEKLGLNVDDYLENNDSYNYLKQTGNLIFTGPTGTNVSDLIIGIKLRKEEKHK
ncbi:MAG: glycerate kinase type-2 family protein [Candidatus Heimdallarchaeota archaeon]